MASHIILPPDDDDDEYDDEEQRLDDEEADERLPGGEQAARAALPFSAMCVRISRDSYPNLRALRNASAVSLADAAYVKISEGDFGYVLDDVPHFADYLPDLPVSAPSPLLSPHASSLLGCGFCWFAAARRLRVLLRRRDRFGSWRGLCGAAFSERNDREGNYRFGGA